jgi:hypothetical protein
MNLLIFESIGVAEAMILFLIGGVLAVVVHRLLRKA